MTVFLTGEYLGRTARLRWESQTGSGIFLSEQNKNLLVTAKHLVEAADVGNNIAISHGGEWKFLEITGIARHALADVAVITVNGLPQNGGLPLSVLKSEIIHGEEIAFSGFPLGMEMHHLQQFNGWPMAFVKSGTFSGSFSSTPEAAEILFFDAINNAGFSGGPIFRKSPLNQNEDVKIIGIVSGYKFDTPRPVMQHTENGQGTATQDYYVLTNSGLMYGYGSDDILATIRDLVPEPAAAQG